MSRMTAPAEADILAASHPALDAAAHQLGCVRKKQMAADRFRVEVRYGVIRYLRNGVLFYLALASQKFAVIGDAGINSKVPDDFWNGIKDNMQQHFAAGRFVTGLREGIARSGEALKEYFPHMSGDRNELSDEIVFGKD